MYKPYDISEKPVPWFFNKIYPTTIQLFVVFILILFETLRMNYYFEVLAIALKADKEIETEPTLTKYFCLNMASFTMAYFRTDYYIITV